METKTAEEVLIEKFGETSDTEIVKMLADACREYADQFKPKWISVEDELPLEYIPVLCFGIGNQIFFSDAPFPEGITHWMPSPEKP